MTKYNQFKKRPSLKKYRKAGLIAMLWMSACLFNSCHYLNVVPDDVATLDYAFRESAQAEKFLFTCYSYLPDYSNFETMPGLITGDEIWFFYPPLDFNSTAWQIARGNQNVVNPYLNYWDGSNNGKPMFQAIRDCNTFLANIGKTPNLAPEQRDRWIAEAEFLKAYYHWFLLRMYGPIPIIDKNLPVSAEPSEVKVYREPVDSCFSYIVNLIDTAMVNLPLQLDDQVSEMGRITKPVAAAIKARILMTEASPLFNGNASYANFVDNKGRHLFNSASDPAKWQKAAEACKEAIDLCQAQGYTLNHFQPIVNNYNLDSAMQIQMDLRTAITQKWNSGEIWAASNSMANNIQRFAEAFLGFIPHATQQRAMYAPPLKIAEMFYTQNGVPIDQDKTWNYATRFDLDTGKEANKDYIKTGYVTAQLNFHREPRYYADLGFDGGIWYGQGVYDIDNAFHVEGKAGQYSARTQASNYSITGMYAKKLVNFLNVNQSNGTLQIQTYPWPIIRLAELYLYYSEALNEVNGPTQETLHWIDLVRAHAGIPSVEDSWTQYSTDPTEYTTKDGFRKIIHQEELIEMAFEGERYWDILRWKEAEQMFNQPIKGWDITQEDAKAYYQPVLLFGQAFKLRDYFWPIQEQDIIVNHNLVQNPGW
ncbi:MAG: RagB/SusD family nutrient uptake outer membrane protein [Chitinophagaceae bacterium]|nr:MAG: RagB/SusD family nutrient uptake outer membrane protein [Chitinophagaceae bacterium]